MKQQNKIAIFLATYVVFLAVLSFAGYYFFADYQMQMKLHKRVVESDRFQSDITYVDLPRISLTLPGGLHDEGGRIRMDITLAVEDQYAVQVESERPRITDRLMHYTQKLNLDDLEHPRTTVWLRPELLKEINAASAPTPVKEVIFREFLVF